MVTRPYLSDCSGADRTSFTIPDLRPTGLDLIVEMRTMHITKAGFPSCVSSLCRVQTCLKSSRCSFITKTGFPSCVSSLCRVQTCLEMQPHHEDRLSVLRLFSVSRPELTTSSQITWFHSWESGRTPGVTGHLSARLRARGVIHLTG